ncbi:MAG: hypothetical protein WD267_11550 [Balneolales bacterium]
MTFKCITSICFVFWFAACSATEEILVKDTVETQYSLIYIIHGDAGYLYHENGTAFKADKRILEKAKAVGHTNPHAEVFIFHQRPKSHILYLFPKKESKFYYYRGGELLAENSYSRLPVSDLKEEAALYHQYALGKQELTKRVFLYYGHEIPTDKGRGYHVSIPKADFNISSLSVGMSYFNDIDIGYGNRFDLAVLSTCNNGTPETAAKLSNQTNYLVASPIDLHLSYMESHYFMEPDNPDSVSTESIAHNFALRAFNKLVGEVHTPVGITLYNTDELDITKPNENSVVTEFFKAARFGTPQQ